MRTRIGITVLLVALMASGCDLLGALFPGTWEIVGSAGISADNTDYVRVDIDETDGVIYAAFQEGVLGSVSVMKFEEFGTQTWEYVGSSQITGDTAKYVSLYVDDGTPYIAFSDDTAGVDGGLSVMMFDGATWVYVGGAPGSISAYSVTYNDIFVENGSVYAAYRESYGTTNLKVSVYAGTAWQALAGDPGFLAGSGGADFIDIDRSAGTTYVSFTDNGTGAARVISSDGSTWTELGAGGLSNGDGEYVSIAIDAGTPYAAFSEGTGTLSVMNYVNDVWSYVVSPSISSGVTSDVSMDFLDGTPIVAYRDWSNNYKLSVQRLGRRDWEYVGEPGISAGQANSVSLKAGNAAYYVAFTDEANQGAVTVMRYR